MITTAFKADFEAALEDAYDAACDSDNDELMTHLQPVVDDYAGELRGDDGAEFEVYAGCLIEEMQRRYNS